MALSFNLWRHFYCLIHRNCLDLKGPYLNTDRDDEKTYRVLEWVCSGDSVWREAAQWMLYRAMWGSACGKYALAHHCNEL